MRSWMPLMVAAALWWVAGSAGADAPDADALGTPQAESAGPGEPAADAAAAESAESPRADASPEMATAPADGPAADPDASAEPSEAPDGSEPPIVAEDLAPVAELEPQPEVPGPLDPAAGSAGELAAGEPAPLSPAEPVVAEADDTGVTLGQIGYDSEGRQGRIHVVVVGDTLWDISRAYLGTPWVWPSIWQDNRGIENPHLIYPGDRIWITDGEMRVVSREEAEALLAGQPAAPDPDPGDDFAEEVAPAPPPVLAAEPRMQRVSTRDQAGFVSAEDYEASASVLDGISDKVMLSEGDPVYIGLGAGDVSRGDRFTVFRKSERVFDPDTGRLLGYHVDLLGWVEIQEPADEASLSIIRESFSEIERGDRLVPYEELSAEIAVLPAPNGVEGKVSFFARSRTMMGMDDFVYVNRGTLDGVEVGSPLEVYRPAYVAREVARGARVEVPSRVIAQLLVVKAEPNSSVAFVTHTENEIELGDHVRAATR